MPRKNLQELPENIIIHILRFLPPPDLNNVILLSKFYFLFVAQRAGITWRNAIVNSFSNNTILRNVCNNKSFMVDINPIAHAPRNSAHSLQRRFSIKQRMDNVIKGCGAFVLPKTDWVVSWTGKNVLEIRDRFESNAIFGILEGHQRPVYGARFLSKTGYHLHLTTPQALQSRYVNKSDTIIYLYLQHDRIYCDVMDGLGAREIPLEQLGDAAHSIKAALQNPQNIQELSEADTQRIYRFLPEIYSPPSTKIISWSDDATIKIWEVETRKCLATLEGHCIDIIDATLPRLAQGGSTTQPILYTCDMNNILRIWDMKTYKCIAALQGRVEAVPEGTQDILGPHIITWDFAGLNIHVPTDTVGINYSLTSGFQFRTLDYTFKTSYTHEPTETKPGEIWVYLNKKNEMVIEEMPLGQPPYSAANKKNVAALKNILRNGLRLNNDTEKLLRECAFFHSMLSTQEPNREVIKEQVKDSILWIDDDFFRKLEHPGRAQRKYR